MRTVHETEALRPSDPVPKNYSSIPPKPQRLKLTVKAQPRDHEPNDIIAEDTELDDDATIYGTDLETETLPTTAPFEYPADVQFTEEELALSPDQLCRLLRRQIHWAEEDGSELKDEVHSLEAKKKEEWLAKELVLANVMEAELANAHDKGEPPENVQTLLHDLPQPILPMQGPQPWYRISQPPVEGRILEERMPVEERMSGERKTLEGNAA